MVPAGTVHPQIPDSYLLNWQILVDMLSTSLEVPATLIMQIRNDDISVLVSSNTSIDNPYHHGDTEKWFDSGLYCETVIRENRSLFVPNALEDENWKNNPDVKLNMINYLGFPIRWPNGDPFGTICVLDSKTHHYSKKNKELLERVSKLIEDKLAIIEENIKLKNELSETEELVNIDELTNCYNRRGFLDACQIEIERAKRYNHILSLLYIDIDDFKSINDTYGHNVGDIVLTTFSEYINHVVRKSDIVGRLGGDEFLILLPMSDKDSALHFSERLLKDTSSLTIDLTENNLVITFTISIGLYTSSDSLSNIEDVIRTADKLLYEAKKSGKNKVCISA